MDINNFRIRENARLGFIVEEKRVRQKITTKWFPCFRKRVEEITERVPSPDLNRKSLYFIEELAPFKYKSQAVEYIETLCVHDKFYYPDKFELSPPEAPKSTRTKYDANSF